MGSRKVGEPRRQDTRRKHTTIGHMKVTLDIYTGEFVLVGDGDAADRNAVTVWVRDTLTDAGHLVDVMKVRDRLFGEESE